MIQGYITPDGVLVLQAGVMTEAYALKCWMANLTLDGKLPLLSIPASVISLEHPHEA